jgi:hypothetical protein
MPLLPKLACHFIIDLCFEKNALLNCLEILPVVKSQGFQESLLQKNIRPLIHVCQLSIDDL